MFWFTRFDKLTEIQWVKDNVLQIDKPIKYHLPKCQNIIMLFSVINITRLIMVNSIDVLCFLFMFLDLHKN